MPYEWNTRPPWSAEQFLKEALGEHAKVVGYEQDGRNPQIWRVDRGAMQPITFYFENVYTLGLADYESITNAHPDIRCIVTVGDWNQVTKEATQKAADDSVTLLHVRGLLGALYKDGEDFYRHRPRE